MDVERTMEFILENLASAAVRIDALTIQQQELAASQRRADRNIHGLQTLMKAGMKALVRVEKNLVELAAAQKRTEHSLAELAAAQKELAAAQKRTDQKFDRWLDSLKGSNGHKKR